MKKTILVVDDDMSIQDLLGRYLGRAGYNVISSPDGKDALKQCVLKRPDLILMDFRMPGLDGLNALDLMNLAKLGRDLPIILMSGTATSEVIDNARKLGAWDFLVKPFNPTELMKKLEQFLDDSNGPVKRPEPPTPRPAPQRTQPAPEPPPAPAPEPEPQVEAPVPPGAPAELSPEPLPIPELPIPELAIPPEETVAPPPPEAVPVPRAPAVAAAPPPPAAPAAVDPRVLKQGLGNPAAVLALIEAFLTKSHRELLDAQLAIREQARDDVRRIAGSLRAEGARLGASQFAALCQQLEQFDGDPPAQGMALLKDLREEYKRCKVELEAFKRALEAR